MSRRVIGIGMLMWVVTAGFASTLAAKNKNAQPPSAPPREPGIETKSVEGVTFTSALLPGRVLDLAPARDETVSLYALVQPKAETVKSERKANDDPPGESKETPAIIIRPLPTCPEPVRLALYRVDLGDTPRLDLVIDDLPSDVRGLDVADLDGDGSAEPLLRTPGALHVVRGRTLERLIEDPRLLAPPRPARTDALPETAGPPHAIAVSTGAIELFGVGPEGGWSRLASAPLPVDASISEGRGASVSSHALAIGMSEDGRMHFATTPKNSGQRRLRCDAIALSPAGEAVRVETWMHLPEPEELLESHFFLLGGSPHVLVLTKVAGRLDLFGEKRLRLYALEPDRSRLGREPVWQAMSRANLWQDTHVRLHDTDGDGREDLVVGYWKGLTGDRVVLDVYRGLEEDGFFKSTPITTAFDVKHGDRSVLIYGEDPTGDGRADLVLSAGGRLVIHSGLPSRKGGDVVNKKPVPLPELPLASGGGVTVSIGTGGVQTWSDEWEGRLRIGDLDGDGTDDLVQLVRGRRDELRIVQLDAAR